jgi:hypothetical protein
MIRKLALGLLTMAAGYALKRLGRWMQDEALQTAYVTELRDLYHSVYTDPECTFTDDQMREILRDMPARERWN